MTEQIRFSDWLPVPQHRQKDPDTSKAGAKSVSLRAGTQMARLAIAYRNHGDMTDDEAGEVSGLRAEGAGYWKRCSDLRKAGIVEPTGDTREGRSGEQQRVCRLTAFGSILVNTL